MVTSGPLLSLKVVCQSDNGLQTTPFDLGTLLEDGNAIYNIGVYPMLYFILKLINCPSCFLFLNKIWFLSCLKLSEDY